MITLLNSVMALGVAVVYSVWAQCGSSGILVPAACNCCVELVLSTAFIARGLCIPVGRCLTNDLYLSWLLQSVVVVGIAGSIVFYVSLWSFCCRPGVSRPRVSYAANCTEVPVPLLLGYQCTSLAFVSVQ